MQDKFSYYDFIANIVPTIFLWWGLTLLPFFDTAKILKNQGEIEKTVVFIVLVYVFGLAVQYLAKNIIEWMVKRLFWEGKFYSEIFWIKAYEKIKGNTRTNLLTSVSKSLGYSSQELAILDTEGKNTKEMLDAIKLSQDIYFKADSYTKAKGLAEKAHTQNSLYSLFRGLSFVCLMLATIFGITLYFKPEFSQPENWIFFTIFILLFIFFVLRTRERGERYIKGLFYALNS